MIAYKMNEFSRPLEKMTTGSDAYDIASPVSLSLPPNSVTPVLTGVTLEGRGSPAFVLSRSGLAKKGVWVANAPGLIDGDYNGELVVLLYNSTNQFYDISAGDRIAQLYVTNHNDLDKPLRGFMIEHNVFRDEGEGLGSTGV